MKIIGINPITEQERARLERPVSTQRWYDRATRSWVVQSLNEDGDQVGDATYVHGRGEAIIDESHRRDEIVRIARAQAALTVKEN